MPPARTTQVRTVGTSSFEPDEFLEAWANGTTGPPKDNDLRGAIIKAFGLKEDDIYVYHAIASVTLAQVQQVINLGDQNGLHAWYKDQNGEQV